MKRNFFLLLLLLFSVSVTAQDTINYTCRLKTGKNFYILYTSIELYPDSTFTWRSEYDLSFETYGTYKISKDSLLLKEYFAFERPKTMSIKDSLSTSKLRPVKVSKYIMRNNSLIILDDNDKEISRIKDKSLRGKGILFRHRFHYIFSKQ